MERQGWGKGGESMNEACGASLGHLHVVFRVALVAGPDGSEYNIYIYIYMYRERERDVYVYIYIYIHMYMSIHM